MQLSSFLQDAVQDEVAQVKPAKLDEAELQKLLLELGISNDSAEEEYRLVLNRFNSLTSWQGVAAARYGYDFDR